MSLTGKPHDDDMDGTPLEKGTQVGFWLPIKIPEEYVSLMQRLPENAKNKIFHRGTYFTL